MSNDTFRLCGLWKRVGKKGGHYLSGKLGNARLLITQNRDGDRLANSPTHWLLIAPDNTERRGTGARNHAEARQLREMERAVSDEYRAALDRDG